MSEMKEPLAVTNFREYIKIKSVQPKPDYDGCIKLLKKLYGDLGCTIREFEPIKGKPVLLFTKDGTEPSLPSILFNSHMDVVPVFESKWKHDPFSGDKDIDGKIYGRGSQDTKCLGIQCLEALRRLINQKLRRTIHVSFVSDEEIGGVEGMAAWVKTEEFKKLNIGCEFDEGCLVDLPVYVLFHSERSIWTAQITVRGQSGHGSMFHLNTAAEKLNKLLDKVMKFRSVEEEKYKKNQMGDWAKEATSINLTVINGGSHHNVLPEEIKVIFDCRLAPTLDHQKFKQWFWDICKESGDGVTVEFTTQDPKWPTSPVDSSNPFWTAFKSTTDKMGLAVLPVTCPGTTDARYLRQVGIDSYGFTPMCQTPTLLHDHNEFVHEDQFMKGIDIMEQVIISVASVPSS